MPTYEYRCKGCGRHLEVVQAFTDDALTTCEACGGDLRKVFGSVGIAFKGSGFYKNDSRGSSSGRSSGDKADSSASSDGGSSDKSSSDKGSDKTSTDKGSSDKKGSADKSTSTTPAKSGTTT